MFSFSFNRLINSSRDYKQGAQGLETSWALDCSIVLYCHCVYRPRVILGTYIRVMRPRNMERSEEHHGASKDERARATSAGGAPRTYGHREGYQSKGELEQELARMKQENLALQQKLTASNQLATEPTKASAAEQRLDRLEEALTELLKERREQKESRNEVEPARP